MTSRSMRWLSVLCFVSVVVQASAARAEEKGKSLFDGKSLDGWTVTDCKAEVEDGAIVLKEGNGMVRTNEKYGDFVLELETKALRSDVWDSGIYIRFDLPLPKGRPWPAKTQVNLFKGDEGGLKGHAKELVVATKPDGKHFKPGEWNKLRITAKGDKVSVELNGKEVASAEGLKPADGYIGLQAEVASGGQFAFRNIRISDGK
ncbi:MAG: DUF1080 domain-containing protein [Pirellulales bacterium]